MLPDFDVTAFR
jgi:hypothetical protein